jgi:hypothetical protein
MLPLLSQWTETPSRNASSKVSLCQHADGIKLFAIIHLDLSKRRVAVIGLESRYHGDAALLRD